VPRATTVPGPRLRHHDRPAAVCVHANHLIGVLVAPGQRVQCREDTQVPAADQHRVLDTECRAARKDSRAGPGTEILWTARAHSLDPPVLGTMGGAAEVQVPITVRRHIQSRALQRLCVHILFVDDAQRVKMDAVVDWRAGYIGPVAPALLDRMPVTIGKIDVVIVNERTGSADPVAGSVRSVQHQLTVLPSRQHDSASLHDPVRQSCLYQPGSRA
jgi:hypothetical protein